LVPFLSVDPTPFHWFCSFSSILILSINSPPYRRFCAFASSLLLLVGCATSHQFRVFLLIPLIPVDPTPLHWL
jgi:hypothetical protein